MFDVKDHSSKEIQLLLFDEPGLDSSSSKPNLQQEPKWTLMSYEDDFEILILCVKCRIFLNLEVIEV